MNRHTILITGGAQGLGKHLVTYFKDKGYQTVVFDIKPIASLPGDFRDLIHTYVEVDLGDISSVMRAIDEVIEKHRTVSVLVNNAAMRVFRNFDAFSDKEIVAYAHVNLITPIVLIRRLFPIMKANGYGRIINITSKSAYWGYSTGTMYNSTKSALAIFTEAFGRELDVRRDNVTVNAICPDSFSSTKGERFKEYRCIVRRITRMIDEIVSSQRNAEVIPILLPKTKFNEIIRRLRDVYTCVTKY